MNDTSLQQFSAPPPGSRSYPAFDSGGTHLRDRLTVIYRYQRVAISAFLLIVLASLLRTYLTTPLYRAEARVMIETESEQVAAMPATANAVASTWQDPQEYLQTEYRVLTGREVARRVVQRLDLGKVSEFNGAGAPISGLKRTLLTLGGQLAGMVRQSNETATPKAEGGAGAAVIPESTLVSLLQGRVSVEPVQNSRLVDVRFVSADPAFAVRAVDALAEEYVQQNLELRRQNIVGTLNWLSKELVQQKQKVEESERAMALYRENQNALSLEERQNIVVSRLNQLNDAVTKAKTNRMQKAALYDQIKTLDADVAVDTIPAILQNPYIQEIKSRLAELQRDRATLLERYGEKYPDVLKVNASLQDASQQLQSELAKAIAAIRNDYQSAVVEERTLDAALEDQKRAATDLNRKSVGYTVLEREAQSNRQVYETLLQREKELQVTANSRGNNVRVMDHAEKPGVPFVPTPRRDLVLAIAAAVVLSLGLVFFLDYLDDTVKNPDDVTAKLNIPLLGMAPMVSGRKALVLSHDVPHEFAEAFRSLRTSLIFSSASEATRVVMVTSALPFEGKTTTACNLALALAIGGARVLLIDADMRCPNVHRTLTIENRTGLSHVLTGQAQLRDAFASLESPSLSVVTAGVPAPNPSELLGSDQMKALLDEARKGGFDWVIFDTPPVLPVTDGVVLSQLVDGIAFVIGSEMTHRPHIARALDTLAGSGARLFGAVLNRMDVKGNRYYYYSRNYGYQNRNYYLPPTEA